MLDIATDAEGIRVRVAMAEQFFDTEARPSIPQIALYCLQAGLSVAAALASLAERYFDLPQDVRTLHDAELEPYAAIDPWSHFAHALESLDVTRGGRGLFDELVARYGETHRHYHALAHIEACLGWLDRYEALAERPAEIALALWFHDAIYDPRASDNESRSADLARERLRALRIAEDSIERIATLILATRQHLPAEAPDTQLLIDIDLSILGTNPDSFDDFEQRIHSEYAHVQPLAFRWGRRRMLQQLLERKRIYQTPALHAELEARARANLERRIRELRLL